MPIKDDAARLLQTSYPLRFTTRILFSDMDAFRHLNNGATARYFEEGRAALNILGFGVESMVNPPEGHQLLFATVTIDYVAQAYYPGEVEIASGVTTLGGSSYGIGQAAFQGGKCFALADVVMVKARHGKASRLEPAERAALERLRLAERG